MMLPTLPAFGQPSAPPPLKKTSVSDEAHEGLREDIALRLGRCACREYLTYSHLFILKVRYLPVGQVR